MLRTILATIFATLVLCGCATGPVEAPQRLIDASQDYRLGAGDVIAVRVFGAEEDLSYRLRLNERGNLTLPFGEFTVIGRTTRELEDAILAAAKSGYLAKPRVSVNIEEYRPYFVQGQVARPGQYNYQPYLNVQRAITIAGGFRERAAKDRIYLQREDGKSAKPIRVDPASSVRPGDTIIVEESFF